MKTQNVLILDNSRMDFSAAVAGQLVQEEATGEFGETQALDDSPSRRPCRNSSCRHPRRHCRHRNQHRPRRSINTTTGGDLWKTSTFRNEIFAVCAGVPPGQRRRAEAHSAGRRRISSDEANQSVSERCQNATTNGLLSSRREERNDVRKRYVDDSNSCSRIATSRAASHHCCL